MNKYAYCSGKLTLEELLKFKTVPLLKDIASCLGLAVKSTDRKGDIIMFLSTLLRNEPQELIAAAFSYELEAFLEVIEGKMSLEYAEKAGFLSFLNRFGLIYAICEPGKNRKLKFEADMAKRLKPLIPAELKRRENDGSLLIEKVALGCTNIYGFTDMAYLFGYIPKIEKRFKIEFSQQALVVGLRPFLNVNLNSKFLGELEPFVSPFASVADFHPLRSTIYFDEPAKEFDIDTIMKYGEMPYPQFPLKSAQKLKTYIEKYGLREASDPLHLIREIWIEKESDRIGSLFPPVDRYFIFHDIDQINECISAVSCFMNEVPFWRLRGNSSEESGKRSMAEMMKEGKPLKILPGPNLRAHGITSIDQVVDIETLAEQFSLPVEAVSIDKPQFKKVGRNDPCPCGSGKKFKHCCGK